MGSSDHGSGSREWAACDNSMSASGVEERNGKKVVSFGGSILDKNPDSNLFSKPPLLSLEMIVLQVSHFNCPFAVVSFEIPQILELS